MHYGLVVLVWVGRLVAEALVGGMFEGVAGAVSAACWRDRGASPKPNGRGTSEKDQSEAALRGTESDVVQSWPPPLGPTHIVVASTGSHEGTARGPLPPLQS